MRRLASLVTVLVVVLGLAALGLRPAATAQNAGAPPSLADFCARYPSICLPPEIDVVEEAGESVFEGATPERLAIGAVPSYPPLPAAFALQRVRIATGGRIVTPADDPRLTLLSVERGTLTVRNTVPTVVTRATGGQEGIPAGTDFTMSAGDSTLSPPHSGGELRNAGSEEVSLLAGIIVPLATDQANGDKHHGGKKGGKHHGGKHHGGHKGKHAKRGR